MPIDRISNGIAHKLRTLTGEADFSWADLFSRPKKFVRLHIRAEENDYDRAGVFIDDVNVKTNGAFSEFSIGHLIHLLYEDFLRQIREDLHEVKINEKTITMEDAVRSLLEKRRIYFPRPVQSGPGGYSVVRKKWMSYEFDLRREAAQRGRVFLHDAGMIYPEFEMSLEELISLLFVDFITMVRRGNQRMLVNMIIERFFSHGFD